jgi:hypothetical protein
VLIFSLNQHHSGSKKRDLEDVLEDLFAREFDDLEELYARGPALSKEIKENIVKVAGSKAGRKAAVELGKNVYTKVAGNALDNQKKKDSAKQDHSGSKKRDLEDVLDELFARGPKNASTKVGGNGLDERKKRDAAKGK